MNQQRARQIIGNWTRARQGGTQGAMPAHVKEAFEFRRQARGDVDLGIIPKGIAANSTSDLEEWRAILCDHLCKKDPRRWMLLFRPTFYVYDEADIQNAGELEIMLEGMRRNFMLVRDLDVLNDILHEIVAIDDELRAMSVGVKLGGPLGREILGEALDA